MVQIAEPASMSVEEHVCVCTNDFSAGLGFGAPSSYPPS